MPLVLVVGVTLRFFKETVRCVLDAPIFSLGGVRILDAAVVLGVMRQAFLMGRLMASTTLFQARVIWPHDGVEC